MALRKQSGLQMTALDANRRNADARLYLADGRSGPPVRHTHCMTATPI